MGKVMKDIVFSSTTQFSVSVGLCMPACGHGADGQVGVAFEEFPNALRLVVELAALRGGESVERLHRDVEFPAGAALVPDPSDCPADEQHRKVSGPAGKEQLAWLAADRVGVEVGEQPYALGCRGRHYSVSGRQPSKGAVNLNWLKFTGEGVEQLGRPPPRCG